MSEIFEIEQDFDLEQFTNQHDKYLICFHATWCGPCKLFKPIIEDISRLKEFESIPFFRINIDYFPDIAAKYDIGSIPALAFKMPGKDVKVFYGARKKEELIELIKNYF